MIRGLFTSMSGMIAQEAKMNSISNNLSNANTTGYKDDSLLIKNFKEVLIQNRDKKVGDSNVTNTIGSLSLGVNLDEVYTDFSQGTIENSDSKTDFAIDGKGFFTVQRNENGVDKKYYTRDGHFHVDSQGFLANDEGDYLLANNGNKIFSGKGDIKVSDNGSVAIDNGNTKTTYNLDIVDFNDNTTVKKAGNNLYSGGNPTAAVNYTVKQNALEKSNVNTMNSMIDMMTVMREFESNQKVIQTLDETLDKSVNQLGVVK